MNKLKFNDEERLFIKHKEERALLVYISIFHDKVRLFGLTQLKWTYVY